MKGRGMAHIMTVQNDDGSYRPLDDRTMTRLKMIDSWRVGQKEQTAQLGHLGRCCPEGLW